MTSSDDRRDSEELAGWLEKAGQSQCAWSYRIHREEGSAITRCPRSAEASGPYPWSTRYCKYHGGLLPLAEQTPWIDDTEDP